MDRVKTWIMAMAIGAGMALAVCAAGCGIASDTEEGDPGIGMDLDEPADTPDPTYGPDASSEVAERDQAPETSAAPDELPVFDWQPDSAFGAPPLEPGQCWHAQPSPSGTVGTRCKGSSTGNGICCGVAGMINYPHCTVTTRSHNPGFLYPTCSGTPCDGSYPPSGNCDPYDWDEDGDPGLDSVTPLD